MQEQFRASSERKGVLTVCIQGIKGTFRPSFEEDNKAADGMLVSKPIAFP